MGHCWFVPPAMGYFASPPPPSPPPWLLAHSFAGNSGNLSAGNLASSTSAWSRARGYAAGLNLPVWKLVTAVNPKLHTQCTLTVLRLRERERESSLASLFIDLNRCIGGIRIPQQLTLLFRQEVYKTSFTIFDLFSQSNIIETINVFKALSLQFTVLRQ